MGHERGDTTKIKEMDAWVEAYGAILKTRPTTPDFIINFDESTNSVETPKLHRYVGTKARKQIKRVQGKKGWHYSVCSFVAASTKLWLAAMVVPSLSEGPDGQGRVLVPLPPPDQRYPKRNGSESLVCTTKEGYMTADAMIKLLQKLLVKMNGWRRGERVLLLMDHHGSHQKESVIRFCLANNIEPIYFPAATTHIIQPLDNVPFARFRQELTSRVVEARDGNRASLLTDSEISLPLAGEALQDALTPQVIAAGFRNTGVYPFDPDLIRQHVREACGGAVELEKSSIAKDVRDFLPIMREITKGQNRPVVKNRRGRFSLNEVFDGREGLQVISVLASLFDMRLS